MEIIKHEAQSNALKTQDGGKIASAQTKTHYEIVAQKCKSEGVRIQYNSNLLNDVESRFRKICAMRLRDELVIFLGDLLCDLMSLSNAGTKMDGVQCNRFAALVVDVYQDMNIADFYAFYWAFRSGRFRSLELEFDKLFNHIDENVLLARLKIFLPVRDRVLQAERNAAENQKSLKADPKVTGVRQVEDAPEIKREAVHISEGLKELGFLP